MLETFSSFNQSINQCKAASLGSAPLNILVYNYGSSSPCHALGLLQEDVVVQGCWVMLQATGHG